mgnify:CR=1 FL=1
MRAYAPALETRQPTRTKAAMKAKEKDRLQVLRLAIHAIKQKLQEGTEESLSDADELAVLQKAVKSRRDSIQQAEELNRPDIAEAEKAELVVLQAYLPVVVLTNYDRYGVLPGNNING